MEPHAKDYARAARRMEVGLAHPAATPDAVIREFLATT
jgi:hypothetical protein